MARRNRLQSTLCLEHIHSTFTFDAIRCLVRAIPGGLPGKLRLARLAMWPYRARRPIRISDRFGNALWCPSVVEPIATSLFACGVYEPDTLAAILARLKPGGVYLDVGANIGALALPVAALRPDTQVVCVEADPDIAAMLRRNVLENGLPNITVVELLAGAETNLAVPFYRAPGHKFGMGSIGAQFSALPISIPQRSLDDILDELGLTKIDVVKLDIEGAELGALRGLARRLADRCVPNVIFEFMDWAEARITGQKPGDAQKYMLSHGYRLFRIAPDGARATALETALTEGSAMILALLLQAAPRESDEDVK
jgi:FkbM family methyltransferase